MTDTIEKQWMPASTVFTVIDTSILMRIHYIGSSASGIVTITQPGDIALLHGVLSSEAADTTVNPGGDTPGTLDLTGGTLDAFTTYQSIVNCINQSANWEAWLDGALPNDQPYVDGTDGHFTEVSGGDADGSVLGYAVKTDDTDSKYCVAGLTNNGPASIIHSGDSGLEWRCNRVIAKTTYASGTSTIGIYECDDLAGTSTLLKTLTAGATTVEVAYPALTTMATEVHAFTRGKRLVAKVTNSAAMTASEIRCEGAWRQVAPAAIKGKMNHEMIR